MRSCLFGGVANTPKHGAPHAARHGEDVHGHERVDHHVVHKLALAASQACMYDKDVCEVLVRPRCFAMGGGEVRPREAHS